MALYTLPERCHTVTGSGDISSLYSEVSGYYNSGSITMILANKLVGELCKRKRVCFHNYTCGLDYFTGIVTGGGTGSSDYFWLLEDGSSFWLLEDGSSKWLIES